MGLTSADLSRLRLLADRDEIRACLNRYARGLDRHDVELITSAFHEDAFVHDPAFSSVAGFASWANAHHLHRWTTHQHFQTNDDIVITEDDVAHCETYCLLLGRREGGDVDVIAARYIDRVERRSGRWAIAERTVVLESTGILDGGGAGQQAMLELYAKGSRDRDDPSYGWMS
jgi:ketosteroid isomerase-like protein